MWNSVEVVSCWCLLLVRVSTTRVSDIAVWLGQYQKRGLSTTGTLYILCVSLVRGRAPFETAGIGLSCSGGGWARWQPGGILGTGVVQYAGIGGWAGGRALVRDAEPSGRVPKFSEGHVLLWRSIPQCFIRPTPHLVQKVRFCFLLLRSLLGRPRGQGLVCFHTPCPGFFKLRWCDAVGVMYWDIRDTNNMGCAQRAAPAPTPS